MNQMRIILRNVFIDFQRSPQDFVENHPRIYSVIKGKRWVTSEVAADLGSTTEPRPVLESREFTEGARRLTERERSAFLAELHTALSGRADHASETRILANAAVLDYLQSPECTAAERDRIESLLEKFASTTLESPLSGATRLFRVHDKEVLLDRKFGLVAVRPTSRAMAGPGSLESSGDGTANRAQP